MTEAENTQLNNLYNTYLAAKTKYEIEVQDNNRFHTLWVNTSNGQGTDSNGMIDGGDRFHWKIMYDGSNLSLAAKKSSMDSALAAYNLYKDDINKKDQMAFQAANPEIAVQLQEQIIKGQNESKEIELRAKNEAAASAAKTNYASSSTKYIILAVIVIVVAIGIYLWSSKPSQPQLKAAA
ncbi:MAG: hypothetical protein V4506_19205 [Bacteroidota bacterium]